jgi:phosphatidylglycerol:prolipoprotein diacylglycerol transferase
VGTGQWQFWTGGAMDRPWEPVPIFSYGVMLGVSLIIGWYLALWFGDKDGLSRQGIASIYVWTAISAVVGARLLYVATNLETYRNPLDILKVNEGGLVAYGGFLGGFAASWYYCIKNRWSLLEWADVAVIPVALGLSITRIGCLLYGCDFGARSTVAWAITFPGKTELNKLRGSPAFQHHMNNYGLDPSAAQSFPVHPTQLYETLLGIAIVGVLLLVRRKRKFSGQMFVVFTVLYGIARTLIELLRDDAERGGIGQFSTSQIIGLVSSGAAIVLYVALWQRYRSNPEKWTFRPRVHEEAGEDAPGGEAAEATAGGRARGRKRR